MNLAALVILVLKVSIILSVVAIGLKASFADAAYLLKRPGELLRALLSINVVMPVVALAIALTFNLNPAVKIALVALSVSPVPPILPNRALKAGGQENYTIGLLVTILVLSVITIPVTIEIFQEISNVPLHMSAKSIGWLAMMTVLMPVVVGIVLRILLPVIADRIAKPLGMIATILLVLGLLPVLIESFATILSLIGDGTLLSLGIFAALGLIVGHLLGGPDLGHRTVLALATATRHPAIALAIANANFPKEKRTAAAILLYLILGFIISTPYLFWVKRSRTVRDQAANRDSAASAANSS